MGRTQLEYRTERSPFLSRCMLLAPLSTWYEVMLSVNIVAMLACTITMPHFQEAHANDRRSCKLSLDSTLPNHASDMGGTPWRISLIFPFSAFRAGTREPRARTGGGSQDADALLSCSRIPASNPLENLQQLRDTGVASTCVFFCRVQSRLQKQEAAEGGSNECFWLRMDTEERPARPAWADSGQNFRTSGMPRLGPQAERSSAWVNRDGEVQAPTQREVGNDVVSRETAAAVLVGTL